MHTRRRCVLHQSKYHGKHVQEKPYGQDQHTEEQIGLHAAILQKASNVAGLIGDPADAVYEAVNDESVKGSREIADPDSYPADPVDEPVDNPIAVEQGQKRLSHKVKSTIVPLYSSSIQYLRCHTHQIGPRIRATGSV